MRRLNVPLDTACAMFSNAPTTQNRDTLRLSKVEDEFFVNVFSITDEEGDKSDKNHRNWILGNVCSKNLIKSIREWEKKNKTKVFFDLV